MSLVAYASSGEEEEQGEEAAAVAGGEEEAAEEEEKAAAAGGGLFSSLPPPKGSRGPAWLPAAAPPSPPPAASEPAVPPPKPKKRPQPVRIAAPQLRSPDSDSEEDDEPAKKQPPFPGHGEGSGLSALLPQPKNLTVKETNRLLLPYAFTKKVSENSQQEPKPAKVPASTSKPLKAVSAVTMTTPSPSAIKAAAKSAALQVTKQITQEENDSDEEVAPENYFSLSEPPTISPEPFAYSGDVLPDDDLPPGTEPGPEPESQDAAANAPLEFKTAPGGASSQAAHGWAPKPGEDYGSQPYSQYPGIASGYYEDYYSGGYYPETADPALGPPQEMSSDASSFMDDEAFKRLQGKRNRGREEINFVEIKGDDQLSGAQQWLTKSLTEEQNMKSFSKKKGEQPTGQQRRKHQITYLIHQAKERELELKNTWAENKLSRRQTQAKYGF
uniref:proline-rich protein PRCC n=1 Tax=Euleptes europaea TaxID=460621 RepID=UPI0025405683|nr:proline-rich protein PRCC [Euleptes europaea]